MAAETAIGDPETRRLLDTVVETGATDLHLATGRPPILRRDGALAALPGAPPLDAEAIETVLAAIADEGARARFEASGEADFAFALADRARFRANAFRTVAGPSLALRRIPPTPPAIEDLGAPPAVAGLADLSDGLVLVTGPTGSGKSTTLAALVARIDARRPCHVLTIEDPIEYVHRGDRALIQQREVGRHTGSFAAALRAALREDPDVLLVGEMRDLETVSLALTAAETGQLVLATLHTPSAAKSIDRIIDVFPGADQARVRAQLATALRAVVAQTLLPVPDPPGGRVAAFEVMIATGAIRNLIREAKVPQIDTMMQMGARHGMRTMADAVDALLADGRVAREPAERLLAGLRAEQEGGAGPSSAGPDGEGEGAASAPPHARRARLRY